MTRRYTIVLTPEPDGSAYNVEVPALPGCLTWGATVSEALARAQDAIAGHIAALEQLGEPVPAGHLGSQPVIIRPLHRRPRGGTQRSRLARARRGRGRRLTTVAIRDEQAIAS